MMRPCPCVSSRMAAFLAGSVNLVIGMTGLSLLALNPTDRHFLLDPLLQVDLETAKYDTVNDTLQLFIEFLLPAVGIFLLGLILVAASITMNSCLILFSFMMSTILTTGCIAGLLSLSISGVDLLGAVPLIGVSILQMFIYWVVIHFNQFSWDKMTKDDKIMLVQKV